MTRDELATRLELAFGRVQTAEQTLLDATEATVDARWCLQQREDQALLDGIDGKNAEVRAALLRSATGDSLQDVAVAEVHERRARVALTVAREELGVLKALARLLGSEG